jgi:hypothetical protein
VADITQETLDQLQELGEEIKRDGSLVAQRSVDICWKWWNVGRVLSSDPGLYVTGTKTIAAETSIRICAALGLSVNINNRGSKPGRPGGETAVRRAIATYERYPDEDAAKVAIEAAGTYHTLSIGTAYGSRLAKSLSVPTSLLDYVHEKTGLGDKEARKHIASYLREKTVQEDIVEFIVAGVVFLIVIPGAWLLMTLAALVIDARDAGRILSGRDGEDARRDLAREMAASPARRVTRAASAPWKVILGALIPDRD